MPILQVEDLTVSFPTSSHPISVVRGVSLQLNRGETLAVVGESGSGKSVTSLAVMGLLDDRAIIEGSFSFNGTSYAPKRNAPRGQGLSMIFQNPMSSLNPVMKVGAQVSEPLIYLGKLDRPKATEETLRLFSEVGLPSNQEFYSRYPHQLSGGMRQRVMIAIALACNPDVLIADEPTTALDVTVQAQILELLKNLQRSRGMAVMIITHDMAVVEAVADRVAVMYAGQFVEVAPQEEITTDPRHPYTRALLAATPRLEPGPIKPLVPIPGRPPRPEELHDGCAFAERCPVVEDFCWRSEPELSPRLSGSGTVRCFLEERRR